MGLGQVKLQWSPDLPAVELREVAGRLQLQAWKQGLGQELRTQDFKLVWEDGETWVSGDSRLAWHNEGELLAQKGELQIDSVALGQR